MYFALQKPSVKRRKSFIIIRVDRTPPPTLSSWLASKHRRISQHQKFPKTNFVNLSSSPLCSTVVNWIKMADTYVRCPLVRWTVTDCSTESSTRTSRSMQGKFERI